MGIWMMPLKSVNGSNKYNASDFRRFYANLFSSGIIANVPLKGSTAFQVKATPKPSMNVQVGAGVAFMEGGHLMSDSVMTLTVPAALSTQNRVDSIVARWDFGANMGGIVYRENSTQVLQDNNVFELMFERITVPAGASSITQANIFDTRKDPKLCGYSSPFDKIQTGDLLAQFKDQLDGNLGLFNSWFTNLKNQLDKNQATNLQNQINNSLHDMGKLASGTDLNTVQAYGIYCRYNIPVTNAPAGTEVWGILEVIPFGVNGAIFQRYTDWQKQKVYIRNKNNAGVFSSWHMLVDADEKGLVNVMGLTVDSAVNAGVVRSQVVETSAVYTKDLNVDSDIDWTDIKFNAGWKSGNFCKYKVKNGCVTIIGQPIINTKPLVAGGEYVIGVLPEGVRPPAYVWSAGMVAGLPKDSIRAHPDGGLVIKTETAKAQDSAVSFLLTYLL